MELIEKQPDCSLFYKTFLELETTSMTAIMAFSKRSLVFLLNDRNSQYFSQDYPLFYKNKMMRSKVGAYEGSTMKFIYYYRSPIDNALGVNQITSAQHIVDYIVKYQNNYYSSYMFQKNIEALFEAEINLIDLLNSNVFNIELPKYEGWP